MKSPEMTFIAQKIVQKLKNQSEYFQEALWSAVFDLSEKIAVDETLQVTHPGGLQVPWLGEENIITLIGFKNEVQYFELYFIVLNIEPFQLSLFFFFFSDEFLILNATLQ